MAKTILCLYYSLPVPNGTGTHIVIYRHLKFLEAQGFNIVVAAPEHVAKYEEKNWQYIYIPKRKPYWLPYRIGNHFLTIIRLYNCFFYIKENLSVKPDIMITVTWDLFSLLAAFISKKWKIPLINLLHDQAELMINDKLRLAWIRKYYPTIFKESAITLGVTQNLLNAYNVPSDKSEVLLPVPNDFSGIKNNIEKISAKDYKLNLVHAGTLHDYMLDDLALISKKLASLSGTLTVICPEYNQTDKLKSFINRHVNIQLKPFFDTHAQLYSYLVEHATAALVVYSLNNKEHAWHKTSFPSKLLEYTQLEIPVTIIAPKDAAVSTWAQECKWQGAFSDIKNSDFDDYIQKLNHVDFYRLLCQQSKFHYRNSFSSASINAKFLSFINHLAN